MELKLYRCKHCGNVAFKVVDKGVPLVCCGEPMEEMVPNTTDAAQEKHVPQIEKTPHGSGCAVKISVGSVEHPMLPEHFITLIAAATDNEVTFKYPQPGDKPELKVFSKSGSVSAYEYCNLHGYWKNEG